jgi:hypothetical protein
MDKTGFVQVAAALPQPLRKAYGFPDALFSLRGYA